MPEFPFDMVGFDLDGTLLDTHGDLGVALNHALALAGRDPVPLAEVRGLVGGGSGKMLGNALERTGGKVSEQEFARLQEALIAHYSQHIAAHTRLFPGGEAMLEGLRERGVGLAVVTNKLEHLARKLLEELGLAERFFAIIGGDTLGKGRAKPAPDLLLEMQRRGGGGRAAFVGDTTYDTGAARAAGMPCIAVSFGFCDASPDALGADAVIDHYDDLIPTLEALGAR